MGTSALLLVLLAGLLLVGWRAEHGRQQEAARLHAGWRAHNAASLLALSAVKGPSAEEQARLDRAGQDPAQLRQALIEIHELRLAYASRDLEDAQRRKAELGGAGGYKVYANRSPQPDLVALVNQDEWAATSQIAQYANALNRIRAWQPVSFAAYAARQRGDRPGGQQVAGRAALPPAVRREKPDPRVPLPTSVAAGVAGPPPPAARAVPIPSAAEVAEAARHPTVTVYAEEGAGSNADETGTEDFAERQRDEAEMRDTLRRWAHAMTLNDPQAEAVEYAPRLDRYFLRRDVTQAFVEADKAAYLRRGNLTASFAVEDVRFENETAYAADVRLIKDVAWERSPDGADDMLIRSRLHLVRTGSGWKIAGEQDFR